MTRAEYLFVIVWIINFIISVLYYLWGALFYVPARERQDKNEEEYIDLIPILKYLFIEPEEFLKPIKEVKIQYIKKD